MAIAYVFSVMKANLYAFYCWIKNNRGLAFMMLLWPYMMAFFLIGIGSILGSIDVYSKRIGVEDPIFYILASSSIMVSSISIVDNVAGELLRHRWVGTLPYVMASPPRFIVFAIAGPIPATLVTSFVTITSILPAVMLFSGITGSLKLFILLMIVYIAMIPLIGLAVVVGGLSLIVREEANIASFLTPLILLVSGVFYPQTILPWILRVIGDAFPLVYVVATAKILALYKIPPFNVFIPIIGMLIALSILYNSLAAPGMLVIEKKIREAGEYGE